jgi:hypothetical protein
MGLLNGLLGTVTGLLDSLLGPILGNPLGTLGAGADSALGADTGTNVAVAVSGDIGSETGGLLGVNPDAGVLDSLLG